jgi:hypothetical protein
MAGTLMTEGCRLLKMKVDKNEPTKFVYFFPDTKYVQERVDQYLANRKDK